MNFNLDSIGNISNLRLQIENIQSNSVGKQCIDCSQFLSQVTKIHVIQMLTLLKQNKLFIINKSTISQNSIFADLLIICSLKINEDQLRGRKVYGLLCQQLGKVLNKTSISIQERIKFINRLHIETFLKAARIDYDLVLKLKSSQVQEWVEKYKHQNAKFSDYYHIESLKGNFVIIGFLNQQRVQAKIESRFDPQQKLDEQQLKVLNELYHVRSWEEGQKSIYSTPIRNVSSSIRSNSQWSLTNNDKFSIREIPGQAQYLFSDLKPIPQQFKEVSQIEQALARCNIIEQRFRQLINQQSCKGFFDKLNRRYKLNEHSYKNMERVYDLIADQNI